MHEPKQAIKVSRDISPGIDTVHYQLLKHLPDDSLILLLYIFNHIWLTQDFPTSWKTAIIIPVPKPGKVLSEPGSYQPIAQRRRKRGGRGGAAPPPPPNMKSGGGRKYVFAPPIIVHIYNTSILNGWLYLK